MIYKGYDIEESPMGGFPVYLKRKYVFTGDTLEEAKDLVDFDHHYKVKKLEGSND